MAQHVFQYDAPYGTQTTFVFTAEDPADADDLYNGTAWASGDATISKDGGAVVSTTNTPAQITASGYLHKLVLTATEMQAEKIVVAIRDQTATEAFAPVTLVIDCVKRLGQLAIDSSTITNPVAALQLIGATGVGNYGMAVTGGAGASGAVSFVSGGGPGLSVTGSGASAGILATGGVTGDGISAAGGATSGIGIKATGQAGNSPGISAVGQGSAAGILSTGGATGQGVKAVGGATSGAGILATSTSGDGITATGGTAGNGILATGGATGAGIMGVGASGSATSAGGGIVGVGVGSGSGGIRGVGSTNASGIEGTGAGSGHGISGTAGASGKICNLFETLEGTQPTGALADNAQFGVIIQWLKRRLHGKTTCTATQLKTYKDDASTVLTTQTVADDGTTQTTGKAS